MRVAVAFTLFVSASVAAVAAFAQSVQRPPVQTPAAVTAAPQATPAPAAARAPAPAATACANPDAIGLARTVEIDTTGGPGFGVEHFKQHDFLRLNEVVLTFDDGPWPVNTAAVLKALAEHCTKATFFPIGKHAIWYPEILKQVAAAGHTVGSHTWSHRNLAGMPLAKAKEEIEKGVSAVAYALGQPGAPFFRFPVLKHPPELVTYLGERNIGIFSTDMDSFDFKMRRPEQVIDSVLAKLKKFGKGIVLLHDFQHATAEGVSDLLKQLKDNGYKIVHMKAKDTVKTLPEYDEIIAKDEVKLPTVSQRPTSSVVRTVE
jgi:peptidoglycan/xylan/chitin deacetylase (PgdA/CDA1 family)